VGLSARPKRQKAALRERRGSELLSLSFLVLGSVVGAVRVYLDEQPRTKGRVAEIFLLWFLVVTVGILRARANRQMYAHVLATCEVSNQPTPHSYTGALYAYWRELLGRTLWLSESQRVFRISVDTPSYVILAHEPRTSTPRRI
jgi:hypothetical protein